MHPQDELLIAESLVAYAGDHRDITAREARAWNLAEEIVSSQGLSMDALVSQIDEEWSGPE